MRENAAPGLTVMTFNLKRDVPFTAGPRWLLRLEAAAQAIFQSGAAVVGVQEMTRPMRRALCARLEALGRPFDAFGVGRGRCGGGEQTAILLQKDALTRLSGETLWLSRHPRRPGSHAPWAVFPRTVTICEAHCRAWGGPVRIFNTHLDHMWESARLLGAEVILREVRETNRRRPMPAVLLGDMNALPGEPTIRRLTDGGALINALPGSGGTYHGDRETGEKTLDYIFLTPDLAVTGAGVDRAAYEGRFPSDHFPVWANIALR